MTFHLTQEYQDVRIDIVDLIPALKAFARTFCRNPSDVDDLVQATLMKALANIEKFQPGTKLKSWLFTIMRNTFCTQVKVSTRETTLAADVISDTVGRPATQDWSVRGEELLLALDELPRHYRDVFLMIVVRGESYANTAEMSGCPIGTVKSRLNRARHLLIEELDSQL